ncbi:MAG: monovalent cation/H+ antiporter subunit D family protein [Elusimicrobia bacterium]|nr:monovalent cation/H+ antiporter subunit D family protein [Candidatus Liberimonas magnetica]
MIHSPVLFIAVPVLSAFFVALAHSWAKRLDRIIAILCATILLVISLLSIKFNGQTIVYSMGGWLPPFGISLVIDALTSFMLVTINTIAFAITIYSWNYIEQYTDQWKYYTLLLLMLTGMNGVVITGDLFNLYLFLEITSLASYSLVAYGCEQEELEASFKYLIMGTFASSMILIAIGIIYKITSTLNLADICVNLPRDGNLAVMFACVLFITGFALKSALVPFHGWLPDAHPAAPAPVSAMLSGVMIKSLGVYALIRITFNIFGLTPEITKIFLILGTLSMIVGVILAIYQWDFKRLLAYHSISQIGYVIIGLGLATPLGILGGLFHLFNHAVFKSLLFLSAGSVEYATGTRKLDKLGGLKEKMPVTAGTSLIASMSIAGVPPFNGFWSKLLIIIACVQADHVGLAIVCALVSIITLSSFLKIQKYAFFGALDKALENVKEAPLPMLSAMVFLACLCILGALLVLPGLRTVFLDPAQNILLSGTGYGQSVFDSLPK